MSNSRLRVMTVVGTRPEIIRMSAIITAFEKNFEHILVHTGQNWDHNLNQVFFDDLSLRSPDLYLAADTSSLGAVLGDVLRGTEAAIAQHHPDALVVLGDTNSCIAALMAKRMKVPVYHLEAGNRSFDPNIPEEINRHLVDHVSDYNLVYTENSRKHLLAEGLAPHRIVIMGSPMREVLTRYRDRIDASMILEKLQLEPHEYILASTHREENVDQRDRLTQVIEALDAVTQDQQCPVLVSTHPRTRKRIEEYQIHTSDNIIFHEPLGFHDYNKLQLAARIVISDSGTISEESTIMGFPAVTLRDAIERPEAIDTGSIVTTGLAASSVVDAVKMTLRQWDEYGPTTCPADYMISDTSRRVVNFIRSTAATHHARLGIRR